MKILLEKNIAIKLKYYTEFAKGEISGMGKSDITKDGNIIITDIALFDQECTGAHTEIDDKSLAKFMHEMHQRGEDLSSWNVWWHTHADFGVSWSTTDETCIKDHLNNHEYLISVVTNKAGDFLGRLDVKPRDTSPFNKQFLHVKYECDVEQTVSEVEKRNIDEEIEELRNKKDELEDEIEKIEDTISSIKDNIFKDEDLELLCEQEVKDKVRDKIKNTFKWSYSGNYKKKEDITKKKQEDYEDALDDILWGYPINYLSEDDLDNMKECPECQNPITLCECDDAIEKWGEEIGMSQEDIENYYVNKYDSGSYYNDHNNILPIIYKKNGK